MNGGFEGGDSIEGGLQEMSVWLFRQHLKELPDVISLHERTDDVMDKINQSLGAHSFSAAKIELPAFIDNLKEN